MAILCWGVTAGGRGMMFIPKVIKHPGCPDEGGRGGGWRRRRSPWNEISAVCLDLCPGLPAKKTNTNK